MSCEQATNENPGVGALMDSASPLLVAFSASRPKPGPSRRASSSNLTQERIIRTPPVRVCIGEYANSASWNKTWLDGPRTRGKGKNSAREAGPPQRIGNYPRPSRPSMKSRSRYRSISAVDRPRACAAVARSSNCQVGNSRGTSVTFQSARHAHETRPDVLYRISCSPVGTS